MRQHYVPQFLLSAWSAGSNDGKLQVFRRDIPGTPTSRLAAKYTGYQEDLVGLSRPVVAGMEKHAVETRFLRLVDNEAARVRDKMLRQGLHGLSVEERSDWCRFLMSLRLRQPDEVQRIKLDASTKLRKSLAEEPEEYEALAGDDDPASLVDWVDKEFPGLIENYGLSLFAELASDRKIAERIFRMKWWLWDVSTGRHELLLSDHPCIFTGGLDADELIVGLPISPSKAFLATKGDEVAANIRAQSPSAFAMRMNESSLSQAKVRAYARNSAPHRSIQNRWRKN